VNLPNNVTEHEVSDIYINAWKNSLKGITVYRDGSREGIMIKKEQKKEDDKFESYVNAPKRPKTLPADFYVTRVKGESFFVMVGLYHEKPYEIFVYKVKENEKSSYSQHRGEITKIKKGVYKFKSDVLEIDNINDQLNTEELATALYSSMLMRTGANLKYIIKTAQKVDDNISSFTAAMTRILRKYLKDEVIENETCPDCGGRIVRENGCIKCIDCGWSKCG
jgi:ribonucleoside-diphosphate reductase alpha chain